jgi:hypothetical protein
MDETGMVNLPFGSSLLRIFSIRIYNCIRIDCSEKLKIIKGDNQFLGAFLLLATSALDFEELKVYIKNNTHFCYNDNKKENKK